MIRSMTGYGQATVQTDRLTISTEMKSVNHRFLEISVKMPRDWLVLEDAIKKKVGAWIKRGKLDIFIHVEKAEGGNRRLSINWPLVEEYYRAHQALTERLSLEAQPLRPMELLALPDVVHLQEDQEDPAQWMEPVLEAVELACQQLLHMRKSEGKNLQEDLALRVATVMERVEEIRTRAPYVIEHYRERLFNRMKDLLAGHGEGDEARLLTEVAVFAEKADINEELTRLDSHCRQFLTAIQSAEPVGRKLDFLLQEMNREANTIGTKANDLEISQKVVDLKAELEKMKEQVQNIE